MANFDRDQDWEPHRSALSKSRLRLAKPDLQALHRAGLSANEVTGDEHWDFLLSILKGKLEDVEKERAAAREKLEDSENFDPGELVRQKLVVRLSGREIDVLNWVIGLPKELMEKGDRAKELLGTIDESAN